MERVLLALRGMSAKRLALTCLWTAACAASVPLGADTGADGGAAEPPVAPPGKPPAVGGEPGEKLPDAGPLAPGGPASGEPCGAVDYLGTCEGHTAVFCAEGRLSRVACADFGLTCGYVDARTGWYCTDSPQAPPPADEAPPPADEAPPPPDDDRPAPPRDDDEPAPPSPPEEVEPSPPAQPDEDEPSPPAQPDEDEPAPPPADADVPSPPDPPDAWGPPAEPPDAGAAPSPEDEPSAPEPPPEDEPAAPEPPPDDEPPAPDDPCGGLDYLGRCVGDAAEWCEDGALRRRDCRAQDGAGCGWVDDSVGYYCGGAGERPQ